MTWGEDMEQRMLEALNGTWRTWETGYPIRLVTVVEGDASFKRRQQYQPRSKLRKRKLKLKLVVNNCS